MDLLRLEDVGVEAGGRLSVIETKGFSRRCGVEKPTKKDSLRGWRFLSRCSSPARLPPHQNEDGGVRGILGPGDGGTTINLEADRV